jgi:hypothetical protein
MRMDKLTTNFQQAIADAQSLAVGRDHPFIEPVHVLSALLEQQGGSVQGILTKAGVNMNLLRSQLGDALDQLGAFELFDDLGFEVVDVIPDSTGGAASPPDLLGIPGASDPQGSAPFGFPALDIAGQEGRSRGRPDELLNWGGTVWPSRTVVTHDRLAAWDTMDASTVRMERFSAGTPEHPGGESLGAVEVEKAHVNGGTRITKTEYDGRGNVTSTTSAFIAAPAGNGERQEKLEKQADAPADPPKGKIDTYQPADGSGGGWCPLFLWQCREALEQIRADGKDPRRILRGKARVLPPPPDADSPSEGPRLQVDRTGLVINPDPNDNRVDRGSRPVEMRIDILGWVLPPKPGNLD